MAEVMDLDQAQVVVVADPTERADQIPGLDGSAAAGGKCQASVLPRPAEGLAVDGLLLAGKQGWSAPELEWVGRGCLPWS
jgi:hypothetical protein